MQNKPFVFHSSQQFEFVYLMIVDNNLLVKNVKK